MSKKKAKPVCHYAILYKPPKGQIFALYSDGDSIGFDVDGGIMDVFTKPNDYMRRIFNRAIRLSHSTKQSECGYDHRMIRGYCNGKVFIVRLGSKNCPVKLHSGINGTSINGVSTRCLFTVTAFPAELDKEV